MYGLPKFRASVLAVVGAAIVTAAVGYFGATGDLAAWLGARPAPRPTPSVERALPPPDNGVDERRSAGLSDPVWAPPAEIAAKVRPMEHRSVATAPIEWKPPAEIADKVARAAAQQR